ncbi:hypothetical protein EDC30_10778 [Paucimonas lemoignei]|uniref:Transmembrane protein n=1 Tax=Paucimonas lemoignei TaxID=29443 RepID=A0A4R3HVL8_PAULE|nr:hypothetical protein [Paucimonas lemoignei]TCS36261.1 hypothetical protein EDC30_10778 [Paucimonas lemoignei]
MTFSSISLEGLLPILLIMQGIIGGIDTLVNHEWLVRLPHRVEAKREIGLHVLREAVYGLLFGAVAWITWQGAWVIVIGALLLGAIVIDAADEFEENKTRVLPQNERMLHFMLILNLGFITLVSVPLLVEWSQGPTALVVREHGAISWILSALGLAAAAWSVRDLLAWIGLRKKTVISALHAMP